MIRQESFSVATEGRGTYDVSGDIQRIVAGSGIRTGLCHVFLKHTSASLILCENADPAVRDEVRSLLDRRSPSVYCTIALRNGLRERSYR